ncbi:MAG: lytic transglycosylase domain-containing protein [Pyrinomonadaceae bacterium]
MMIYTRTLQILVACALVACCAAAAYGKKTKARRTKSQHKTIEQLSPGIRLKLIDGSSFPVEEAWESAQGVWYRRDGISHLIARERVKTIERGVISKPLDNVLVAKVPGQEKIDPAPGGGPAWIYLIGGARVEADNVTESTAGVWYSRGPLSIFVDRARVDHIEREALETLAESDSSNRKERGWTTGKPGIDSLIRQSGAKYGVDPYLIFCVMEQESHFNIHALSPKGARGLMQLMPGTSARLGVKKPSDPAQNIAGGTRYLRQLIQQFNGRIDLVLASYNAGEGAVMKYGGRVPPYRETRDYVKRISFRYRRTKAVAVAPTATISSSANGGNGGN